VEVVEPGLEKVEVINGLDAHTEEAFDALLVQSQRLWGQVRHKRREHC